MYTTTVLARCLTLLCACGALVGARPSPTRLADKRAFIAAQRDKAPVKRDSPPEQDPKSCGKLIDVVNEGFFVFYARDAYACLQTVPFNAAVATRFVDYWNTTFQFQSTLAYLKNPPPGYQQPALDMNAELVRILDNIKAARYTNQYNFEVDMQSVVNRVHDGHVSLDAGVLAPFVFASPYELVTASRDGKETPQVYLRDDIEAVHNGAKLTPSPIVAINGVETFKYLSHIAALESHGFLEPHADWNAFMSSPSQDIQSTVNFLGGGLSFYPGHELNFTLANKTEINTWWLSVYTESFYTGPLSTGGDFYNYFVLGLVPPNLEATLPAAFKYTDDSADDTGSSTGDQTAPVSWTPFQMSSAYPPNPDVVQKTESLTGGGVSGYFLKDTSTGVLSIPSFSQTNSEVGLFSDTVADFIEKAQEADISNVIIDLQGNPGGFVELAFVTFRQFFPGMTPFAGSRRRMHPLADALGKAFTDHWDKLSETDDEKLDLQASEWVVTNRLDASTGKNFSSWKQYAGPKTYHQDSFSLLERYDLANEQFDTANFDGWVPVAYTEEAQDPPPPAPWKASNIVVLTDGQCSSSCSLFVEMLTQVGVRSVVVGGQPIKGPMQAVSGTRGAQPYDIYDMDTDMIKASQWIGKDAAAVLPQVRDTGMLITYASVNLRDQVRQKDKDATPLQFLYLPADCRLYFSLANVWNMTALWHDVYRAVWKDSSLCVEGSSNLGASKIDIPTTTGESVRPGTIFDEATDHGYTGDGPDPLSDSNALTINTFTPTLCNVKGNTCDVNHPCKKVEIKCSDGIYSNKLCVEPCSKFNDQCPGATAACSLHAATEGGVLTWQTALQKPSKNSITNLKGFCVPYQGSPDMCKKSNGAQFVRPIAKPTTTTKSSGTKNTATVKAAKWNIGEDKTTPSYHSELLGDIWI